MGTRANAIYSGEMTSEVRGMIDARASHNNITTWPAPLTHVRIEMAANGTRQPSFMDCKAAMDKLTSVDGVNINFFLTSEINRFLVRLNSRMYNEGNLSNFGFVTGLNELSRIQEEVRTLLNGRGPADLGNAEKSRLDNLEKRERLLRVAMTDVYREDIPSLMIVPTMDMELAHIDGYEGEFVYRQVEEDGVMKFKIYSAGVFTHLRDDEALVLRSWECQISDTEAAVMQNPLRLYPLFSYEPRRYGLSENIAGEDGCNHWRKPFARIVGHGDSANNIKKVWLGFCMNPALGFRPFDEFCEHLPRFYKQCEANNIPILACCAPEGITTHEARFYKNFDNCEDIKEDRAEESKKRHEMISGEGLSTHQTAALCSDMYQGKESVVGDVALNHFYMNYGHPRNWIPVLKHFPDLHLCLSGFGGNSEWQQADWSSESGPLPAREWIRCIIKLTRYYKNVYADVSGLNIYDEKIKSGLLEMLKLAQEDDEFKHLKYKLIFGSGGCLTYLTDVSNGGGRIRHNYSNYCYEFKNLFCAADKEKKEKLWERVSLINPWNFYGLSGDKINTICKELENAGDANVNAEMLNGMKRLFNGFDEVDGLINHLSRRNREEPPLGPQVPDEGDEDLAAVEEEKEVQNENGLYKPDPERLRKIIGEVVTWVIEESGQTPECANENCKKKGNECPRRCSINQRNRSGPIAGSACVGNRCGRMRMACSHGVREAFRRLTGSLELAHMNANTIYEHLHGKRDENGRFETDTNRRVIKPPSPNFTQITIGEMQEYANNGHIVIAAASALSNGHVVMGVPGEEVGGSWWKYREDESHRTVPVVMETGLGKRETRIGINYSWGRENQKKVVFYRYNRTTPQERN